jgi:hypothetical protein
MKLQIHTVRAEVAVSSYGNGKQVSLRLTDWREQSIDLDLWPADDALWLHLMALPKAADYEDRDAADGTPTPLAVADQPASAEAT